MPAFDKRVGDFEKANTQVVGISTDSPFSHENWAKAVGISHYPLLSDVHRFEEIAPAARALDIVQVPAFLCRQTDFIMETAREARVLNIKKGQFLSPGDVSHAIEKARSAGGFISFQPGPWPRRQRVPGRASLCR